MPELAANTPLSSKGLVYTYRGKEIQIAESEYLLPRYLPYFKVYSSLTSRFLPALASREFSYNLETRS